MSIDTTKELGSIGAYRLLSRIGKGGMGEVFRAWDDRLKRHVAIKRIRAERSYDKAARTRFRREAQAVARLSHPAIVQIFDVLETEDGDCIVMEYVEGEDLAKLIRGEGLELPAAIEVAAGMASGLAHAHHKGLIHRDLKPENVIVVAESGSSGTSPVKILDFGLARALTGQVIEGMAATLTEPGAVMGTVHAMSPEQAMGEEVDHLTDLFALGTILYEMIGGRPPFRGKNWIETLNRVIHEAPDPIDAARLGIPQELAALTLSLLEKDRGERPQSAEEVIEVLRRVALQLAAGDPAQASGNWAVASGGFQLAQTPSAVEASGASAAFAASQTAIAQVRTLVLTELLDRAKLVLELGKAGGSEVLARHDEEVRGLLEAHHGYEVASSESASAAGFLADFLVLFERPIDAVSFALAYQQAVAEMGEHAGVAMQARAAVHLGEVRPRPEVGIAVDDYARTTATRLLKLAGARQTLLTRGTFDLARRAAYDDSRYDESKKEDSQSPETLHWLAHGAYVFRDIEDPVEVFEVGVTGFAPLLAPEGSQKALRSVAAGDEMVLGWRPAVGLPIPNQPNWTLEERAGEGGFGEVWLARHKSEEKRVFKFCFDPARLRSLKREVTLFRLLKQTLGNRDDIARIIEWNFDESPFYLAAEYTEGGSLVTWCNESGGIDRVPLETRVELIAQVAVALSAAHSVGVLHKDVKPENVLVTTDGDGTPRIRLTDFGIGLLTDDTQLLGRLFTIQGMTGTGSSEGEGTQMYMAPELLEGKPPSVQADIYSLGVMLYQVVVGDFHRALATGWRRDIDDDLLADDIAYFVDGRPERRAESALEVAKRLRSLEERRQQRQLEQQERREAEAARRALLRAQRRRRVATTAVGVLLLTLAVVLVFALRERQARQAASREAQTSQRVTELLVDLFGAADPFGTTGDVLTVRELLDRGTERIRGLDGEPEVQATLLHTMGNTYKSLGLFKVAIPLIEEAIETRRRSLGPRHPLVAESLQAVGEAQCRNGEFAAGEKSLREALDIRREIEDRSLEVGETVEALGHYCLQFAADFDGAETALREAVEIHRSHLGPGHPDVAENEHRLALVLSRQGLLDEAVRLLGDALASKRQHAGRHPDVARVLVNLAVTLWWRGDELEAEPYAREAVEIVKEKLPEAHPLTAVSTLVLGCVLHAGGKLEEAESVHRETLAIRDRLGDRTFRRGDAATHLAWVLIDRGDFGEAEATIDESLAVYREAEAPEQVTTQFAKAVKGACLAERGDPSAEELLLEAYDYLDKAGASSAPYRRATLEWLVQHYDARGLDEEAERYRSRLQRDAASR